MADRSNLFASKKIGLADELRISQTNSPGSVFTQALSPATPASYFL